MVVVGMSTFSLLARFFIFQYFLAKPISDINKSLAKNFSNAALMMQATSNEDYSTRGAYSNDADWAASTFNRPTYARRAITTDDTDDAAKKPKIPVVPASSWVVFVDSDTDSAPVMHARLSLQTNEGAPFLRIELTQPRPAIGDQGAAAQIAFASVNQAHCGDADGLVLRFDNKPPVHYATKGVWGDGMCQFALPNFAKFRDNLINASTLNLRIAKGAALTQEIPTPIGGLSWTP